MALKNISREEDLTVGRVLTEEKNLKLETPHSAVVVKVKLKVRRPFTTDAWTAHCHLACEYLIFDF